MFFAVTAALPALVPLESVNSGEFVVRGDRDAIASVARVWFPDRALAACFGRSEIGSRPPVPLVKKAPAPKARIARRKKPAPDRLERLLQRLIEEDRSETHALNLEEPAQRAADEALAEMETADASLRIAAVNPTEVPEEGAPALEPRYVQVVGEYRRNDYSQLRAGLETLEAAAPVAAVVAPEKKEPRLVIPAAAPTSRDRGLLAYDRRPPVPVRAAVTTQPAAAGEPELVVNRQSAANAPALTPGGTAHGDLELAREVVDFLEERQGHIELFLHPVRSRDPQDTIFLTEYRYPSERFTVDTRELKGQYRLVANIFARGERSPVAQVAYPHAVTVDSHRSKLRFAITAENLRETSRKARTHVSGILLTASVFEAAPGDYRHPKPVPNPTVTVVGLGEHGVYRGDGEGYVRIQRIPTYSEIWLRVSAEGYYTTQVAVPTFGGDVHTPIYLVSRDKVDTITRYFTKSPQESGRTVLMGRVFDPGKRSPKDNERLSLSFRRDRAVYFDALPDPWLPATTKTGLFGFFNVTSSFRALRRSDKGGRALLVNLLPDMGAYVELGRGGVGTLRGRLLDPASGAVAGARVGLVGDPEGIVDVGPTGTFEMGDLDLPPGVLTLEVQADAYPLTWHTVPWNNRYTNRKARSLFMMESDLIREGAAAVARVTQQRGLGTVVGGAEANFFSRLRGCVTVSLVDHDGRPVAADHGPHPLHSRDDEGPLCLTRERPGFTFFNLPAGEYLLKWVSPKGVAFRTHVVRVGMDRVSVVVN